MGYSSHVQYTVFSVHIAHQKKKKIKYTYRHHKINSKLVQSRGLSWRLWLSATLSQAKAIAGPSPMAWPGSRLWAGPGKSRFLMHGDSCLHQTHRHPNLEKNRGRWTRTHGYYRLPRKSIWLRPCIVSLRIENPLLVLEPTLSES